MADKLDLSEVIRGVEAIWDNRTDEAEAILSSQKDSSPAYATHYAEFKFLQSFITADANDTKEALDRCDAAQSLAESHVKYYEKGQAPPGVTLDTGDKILVVNKFLEARLALGHCLQMTAILKMTRGSKLKAPSFNPIPLPFSGALLMRKSWKIFEWTQDHFKQTDKYHPELVHAMRFGAGMFYFALSIVPSKYLRFAELAGFKADRALGLKYIREVSELSRLKAPYAMVILLFNNLILPRGLADVSKFVAEADTIIRRAVERYPNGTIFQMLASHCRRKMLDLEGGLAFCKLAIEHMHGRKSNMYLYELGAIHFMLLDWQRAVEVMAPLMDDASFQVRGLCGLQVAACHLMLKRPERAQEIWKKIPEITKKYSNVDTYVIAVAQRNVSNGGHFAAFEVMYIRRDLAKMASVMPQALALLDEAARNSGVLSPDGVLAPASQSTRLLMPHSSSSPMPTACTSPSPSPPGSPANTRASGGGLFTRFKAKMESALGKVDPSMLDWTNDHRASYLTLKGAMLKYQTNLGNEEAVRCFNDVVAMQSTLIDKWSVPYCLYELCESYFYQGKTDQAVAMLKKCIACKDFNWEDPLKVRIRVTADQLKHGPGADEVLLTATGAATAAATDIDDDDGSSLPSPSCSSTPGASAPPSPAVSPSPVAASAAVIAL
eukprot:m51a1_g9502 hypothetical protein (664) ;mRNA; r:668700-671211